MTIIKIEVTERSAHTQESRYVIERQGGSSQEFFLDTFRAALVAAGFSVEIAAELDFREKGE